MKVLCSLKSAKTRDKDCKLVRRKGRIYIINKKNPRMKARQWFTEVEIQKIKATATKKKKPAKKADSKVGKEAKEEE